MDTSWLGTTGTMNVQKNQQSFGGGSDKQPSLLYESFGPNKPSNIFGERGLSALRRMEIGVSVAEKPDMNFSQSITPTAAGQKSAWAGFQRVFGSMQDCASWGGQINSGCSAITATKHTGFTDFARIAGSGL